MKDSNKLIREINRYEFIDSMDIFILCIALSELKKYSEAVLLYKKFEVKIRESNNEIVGLKTIISICKEKNDIVFIEKFERKLEKIIHLEKINRRNDTLNATSNCKSTSL